MTNGQLTVYGAVFKNCHADTGGVMALHCSKNANCSHSVARSVFGNNSAVTQGGVLFYDKYHPMLAASNAFLADNTAVYGPILASYSYSVRVIEQTVSVVASGQAYTGRIRVEVVDADGQRINIDNSSNLVLVEKDDNHTQVVGEKQVKVVNGVGEFSNVVFIAPPQSLSVPFVITNPAINSAYLQSLIPSPVPINEALFYLDFRQCQRGEIEQNAQCVPCEYGSYSLTDGATECLSCPADCTCDGGDSITLPRNQWRKSVNSSVILKCLIPDACIGGTIT